MRGERIGRGYDSAYEIPGLDSLVADLAGLPRELADEIIRDAVAEAFQPALEMARSLCPVGQSKTGSDHVHLRETIHILIRKDKRGGGYSALISTGIPGDNKRTGDFVGDHYYAGMVEFGTSRMRASPYMRPAFDRTRDAVEDRVGRLIFEGIAKALKRG